VANITPDETSGKTYVLISKVDRATGKEITKRVSTDRLREWQAPEPEKPNPNLIDSVPKSAEEASKQLEESEQSRLTDKYKPTLDALSEELNRLTDGLSVDDRLELRSYQNGDLLIRKGWEVGEGGIDYTSVGEQTKRDAYDKMTNKAKAVASQWSQTYSRYEEIQKLMRQ
jgi:hypothetical protein